MENQGLPNAGLWDQRAALQWTKDNIHLLGGDPTQVTAMGESAGAGSIMHHLVAEGGTLDPLFKRAIMQSAAFQPMWDRKGQLEDVFQTFAKLSGCAGQGPAPDGSFIRQLPSLEFASRNFYTGVDALISSHTSDEATLFVDGHVATDAEFSTFLGQIFPAVSIAPFSNIFLNILTHASNLVRDL
jgi:carboxylesterase type B